MSKHLLIEADGGSRGNPGPAGAGTVVRDADTGTVLASLAYVVGKATNNVAEYRGLLNGLEVAASLGANLVSVRMDSKLVVEQMSGRWKIKHPDMRELAMECKKIERGLEQVEYQWVPRKQNSRADELANKAMDAIAQGAAPGYVEGYEPPTQKPNASIAADSATTGATSSATDSANAQDNKNCPKVWNGATTEATRFLLLRHGQTALSAQRRYSGRSNPELSAIGEQQANAAAQHLAARGGIDAIVASPLRRCQQTAQAVADAMGLEVHTVDPLQEMDFGDWDGLTFAEARASDPERHQQWLEDPSMAPPGGESLAQVYRRVKKARARIAEDFGPGTILVVSHVTPIKAVLREALGAPATMFHKMHLDLASLSIAEFYADGPTCVRLVNDTSYLPSAR
ncbi:bifunctional RNase H/acid phosphatase [Corynebacterium pelargi]|uniref:Phosphoserine phosphatase 1 n=1 Tax=Corynebacterium pelargi TaxID=1471400 RepID=A0A410W7L4_9CORY|nr:bifunctional RNase H/acid phosphatase [Corynebacterium pelargi]QAU51944.1 Phosphoserine phosphatase 1 [Corynebacterium pelargi]GGG71278.1 bifunctional RNase H/acid phosphatase [Corynebacterium pelargi]